MYNFRLRDLLLYRDVHAGMLAAWHQRRGNNSITTSTNNENNDNNDDNNIIITSDALIIIIIIIIWLLLLTGVGPLRYLFPPNASVLWQPDVLPIHIKKWFLGAGFLGAPPMSLVIQGSYILYYTTLHYTTLYYTILYYAIPFARVFPIEAPVRGFPSQTKLSEEYIHKKYRQHN